MVANVIMNIIKKLCDSIDKLLTALGAHDWHEAFSCRENEGILIHKSFLDGAHHQKMTQNDVEAADWYNKILK